MFSSSHLIYLIIPMAIIFAGLFYYRFPNKLRAYLNLCTSLNCTLLYLIGMVFFARDNKEILPFLIAVAGGVFGGLFTWLIVFNHGGKELLKADELKIHRIALFVYLAPVIFSFFLFLLLVLTKVD